MRAQIGRRHREYMEIIYLDAPARRWTTTRVPLCHEPMWQRILDSALLWLIVIAIFWGVIIYAAMEQIG